MPNSRWRSSKSEREPSNRQISALETVTAELVGKHPLPASQEQGGGQTLACASRRGYQLLPAEQPARSRVPALIEYSAQETYVIISSQEGKLHLMPNSAEWFEWLATLPSFRFVGQQGRFTAYRHSRSSRSWRAPSGYPPASLQADVGCHRSSHDSPFGASGSGTTTRHGFALIH